MSNPLETIDPEWAWKPHKNGWNRRAAAHLFRRAAFGASSSQLDQAVQAGLKPTVKKLLRPKKNDDHLTAFSANIEQLGQTIMAGGDPKALAPWWLYRMINSPDPLQEKLTLFWHGHFATSAAKVSDSRLMKAHDSILRTHARGNFGALVQAIAQDPAMLIWLDSTSNRKARPNENFARELLELFCLGPGNYTEEDIRQIARTFTGWEVRRGKFRINPYQHDKGTKTFFGHSGEFNGEDAVRIVLEHPAAPRFIARKLIHYFVCDEPALPKSLIEPIAIELRKNDFNIAPAVERILTSNFFFSNHSVARKVRSPVELAVGLLRAFDATTNNNKLNEALARLGQELYYPPNVKGWDGGRTWINSSTLLGRANLVRRLFSSSNTRFAAGGLAETVGQTNLNSRRQTVDWLLELLVATPIPSKARDTLIQSTTSKDPQQQVKDLTCAISLLPEFQLC